MRYKATFVAGLATGYVLGARAGRARYEQIRRLALAMWNRPVVQGATDSLGHQASSLYEGAKAKVSTRIGGRDVTDEISEPTTIRL
jgi:hypothetical protein